MAKSARPAVLMLLAALGQGAFAQPAVTEFSGYYKNLLLASRTVVAPERAFVSDLNRLRMKLLGTVARGVALEIQYEHELLLGNYLRTQQFIQQKEARPDNWWVLDDTYLDGTNAYARHRLHRAFVTWTRGATELRAGRQRIAWGTGRFFSPLDRVNPLLPTAVERDERTGVDAIMLEQKTGAVSRLSAVYVPRHPHSRDIAAIQWHDNTAGTDWSLTAGRFAGDRLVGLDLASQVGDAGWRAELVRTMPRHGSPFSQVLVGLDYAFANTLTLTGELYYNGGGTGNVAQYDVAALLTGRTQGLARRYAALYASYEITPLLKTINYAVANLDDTSQFLSPTLVYSARPNLDLTFGLQWYQGAAATEFGRFHKAAFIQVQYFF